MEQANSIECVNFELGNGSITFDDLMRNPIFSPSGRFAVTLKLDGIGRMQKRITSIYIFDTMKMTFHKYENRSEQRGVDMPVDIAYWYEESSIIVVAASYTENKFLQTPIIMHHKEKTFEINQPASYSFSGIGIMRSLAEFAKLEAAVVVIEEEEYVIWVAQQLSVVDYMRISYAIPRKPYSKLKPKMFMLPLSMFNPARRVSPEMRYKLEYYIHIEPLVNVIDNIAYFSLFRLFDSVQLILGIYLAIDFSKMIDIYEVHLNVYNEEAMREFYDRQKYAWKIVECGPSNRHESPLEHILRSEVKTGTYGGKLVTIDQARIDERITNITCIDFATNSINMIEPIAHYGQGEQSVLLTPYNVLLASQSSAHRIKCSIVPFPAGNKMSSLYKTALKQIYLRI